LTAVCGASNKTPPWEKPLDAWTTDDVAALLNNSPWSLKVGAVMFDPADTKDPEPVGPPDTGEKGNGGVKARWDGQIGRNRIGHPPTIPVLVRWESALPIRQAQKDTAAPADSYVISVAGLVPAGQYREVGKTETTSSSDGSRDARNPEEVLEAFMAYSKISFSSGAERGPENVKIDPATGVIRIFFSRKVPISPREEEAVFETHFGKLTVHAKFHLYNMRYRGNPEL
jgi:hypothetical protein